MKSSLCVPFLLLVIQAVHALPMESEPNSPLTDTQCDLDLQVSNEHEIHGVLETSAVKINFQAIKQDDEIHATTTTISQSDADSSVSVYLTLPDIKGGLVPIEKLIVQHAVELVESRDCNIPTNLNVLHEELADKLYQCTKEMGMSQLRFSIMHLESVVTSAQRICNGAESICTAFHGEGLFMCEEDLVQEEKHSVLSSSYTVGTDTSRKDNVQGEQVEKGNQRKMKRGINCDGISGRDYGCCGNYPGPCYYCSLACLAHDIACWDCAHWWCGPQCRPSGLPPVGP